jgi:replication factor C subunit 3/5
MSSKTAKYRAPRSRSSSAATSNSSSDSDSDAAMHRGRRTTASSSSDSDDVSAQDSDSDALPASASIRGRKDSDSDSDSSADDDADTSGSDLNDGSDSDAVDHPEIEQRVSAANIRPELSWVEKYRPSEFKQIIGNSDTISTITRLVEVERGECAIPHILMYGRSGTGKTTTALVASKRMYGEAWQYMVLELNASNDRGIDVVRNKIVAFVSTANVLYKADNIKAPRHPYKLVILDEVDLMTDDAQKMMRRLMEESAANARFWLICNLDNKIDPAIQSRCVPFRFQPLDRKCIVTRLRTIATAEHVKINDASLDLLAELSDGDMRRSINILQGLSLKRCSITEQDVYASIGVIDRTAIRTIVSSANPKNSNHMLAYTKLCDLVQTRGYDLKNVMTGLHRYIASKSDIPNAVLCQLLIRLQRLELCLASVECDRVHIATIVGILVDWQRETASA